MIQLSDVTGGQLDSLASWCERIAIALRDRSAGTPALLM